VLKEDSCTFSVERDALALEVAHTEHGHGVLMIVCGQFGVELSGFDVVFSKAILANKVVISQLINGLDGLRVKELTVGNNI
jgi:hypothetical protein